MEPSDIIAAVVIIGSLIIIGLAIKFLAPVFRRLGTKRYKKCRKCGGNDFTYKYRLIQSTNVLNNGNHVDTRDEYLLLFECKRCGAVKKHGKTFLASEGNTESQANDYLNLCGEEAKKS